MPIYTAAEALELNIDAAQRELDRRNAEGEDVGAYRVCRETGRIIKCAKAEAIANANAHLYNAGLPAYGELVQALIDIANFDPTRWDAATLGNIARRAVAGVPT